MRPGTTYDAVAAEAAADRMTLALTDAGHASAHVIVDAARDTAQRTVRLTFRVETPELPTIERIDIAGNTRTRDHVIRRELDLTEGAPFNPVVAERARKRLLARGLFKSVDIATAKATSPGHVAVTVTVDEAATRTLDWGAGYATDEGITGDISLTERNLMGRGQYVKLLLAGSAKRQEAALSVTEPRFLGTRIAVGADVFYKDTDSSAAASHQRERIGGSLRAGYDLGEGWAVTGNYTLMRNRLYEVGSGASAAIRQATGGASSAVYMTSSAGYTLVRDARDRTANPTSGTYLSTSQDLAGLGGDTRFLRTTAEARGYIPITSRITLATRMTGGHITGWGGTEPRLLDLFTTGGETIRGFAPGGIGPRDAASANRDALGGTSFLATTAELRFPLPFMPQDFGLRAALFADAGSLWGASRNTKTLPGIVGTSATLRSSAGGSLIWDSPLGPLRVDYAQPLSKQPFDKLQPLRFGLVPGF